MDSQIQGGIVHLKSPVICLFVFFYCNSEYQKTYSLIGIALIILDLF